MSGELLKTILEAGGLGVAVLTIMLFYKLASDHIRSNTKSLDRLSHHIKESVKETKANRIMLSELNIYLKKSNGKK